ncbi:uncharacterized protein LOC141608510 [Silene latifolia]|uniref:uncharacterized protein LOC141608510 n=1 Tax=Silene latifolia TaxID=37657 RepID=UPI003D76CDEE
MGTTVEELLKKIKRLEAEHAELREEVSKLMNSNAPPPPPPPPPPPGYKLNERQYLNISDSMGRCIHIFDSHGRIIYWNRFAENLYGYSATEAIGRTIFELLVSYRVGDFRRVIYLTTHTIIKTRITGNHHFLHAIVRRLHTWTFAITNFKSNKSLSDLFHNCQQKRHCVNTLQKHGGTHCQQPTIMSTYRDVTFAEIITKRCSMGETWTGRFPVTHKTGQMFTIFATNSPFYDDDGTFIGTICLSCDTRLFKDIQVSTSDPVEEEMGQEFSRLQSSVTTRFSRDPDQPLKTAIASKITNLASKVSNKVRAKMKIGESNVFRDSESADSHLSDVCREDGNSSGASTSTGDPADTPAGVFSSFATGKAPAHAQGDSVDDGEGGKPGIHKMITSMAEARISKKAMQLSGKGKGTERESPEPHCGRFGWQWMQSEQDSNWAHPSAKSESPKGDHNRPVDNNEASGSSSSFNVNSNSSASSCGRDSSSATHKLEAETTSLDYEIVWEDLTVGEQIGQGSCGTVYHGLWYGSDVAIKVFSKQEYSEEVILSFRQEVSLMKQLRHPNILLFMGAVTSPQRLCIVTEFLPRGSLFRLLQKSTSKLDWKRRMHIALDIARGMNYLHKCNPPIVHRDLKSSNLLVDKNWSVKVADFGLSRVKHETYLTTKTGKGTPQWMAPEVLQNERTNEKSDLYSFGIILWELATQRILWENLNAMQVIGAVGFMNQRLDIPQDVDPMWASMIESCWHSEPQSRPTFQELVEKLKDMQKKYVIQSQAARASASADVPPKQLLVSDVHRVT